MRLRVFKKIFLFVSKQYKSCFFRFQVKFLSHDCGSFVDCLVIEFRDTPRPVLMIKFQIEVNLKDSINLDAIKVNRPEKVTDDWEKTRCGRWTNNV